MQKLTVKELLKECNAKLLIGNEDELINECFINSKLKTENGCFFGMKNDEEDSSYLYKEAFDNGAKICVLNKIYDIKLNGYDDRTVVISNDTIKLLKTLAIYKRKLFKGKVIAITGSIGKTYTKELLINVLKRKYKVNIQKYDDKNIFGFLLNMSNLNDEDIFIVEVHAENKDNIQELIDILNPNISLITNIYTSHLEIFNSRFNILETKLKIKTNKNDNILIINNDNDLLNMWYENIDNKENIIKYAINNESDIKVSNINENTITTFNIEDISDIRLIGTKSYIYNFLACYAICKLINVENDYIKDGFNSFDEGIKINKLENNITLISDCNSNSIESLKESIKYLGKHSKRKILIINEILNLGEYSKKLHKNISKYIIENNINYVITIGKNTKIINKELYKEGFSKDNFKHFKKEYMINKYIKNILQEEDIILISGCKNIDILNIVKKC